MFFKMVQTHNPPLNHQHNITHVHLNIVTTDTGDMFKIFALKLKK